MLAVVFEKLENGLYVFTIFFSFHYHCLLAKGQLYQKSAHRFPVSTGLHHQMTAIVYCRQDFRCVNRWVCMYLIVCVCICVYMHALLR